MTRRAIPVLAALVGISAAPSPAHAYEIEGAAATGCHERITMTALREARAALTPTTTEAASLAGKDRAIVQNLPYALDVDMVDLAGAAITLGVRNDDETCLRAVGDDEPNGNATALARCRSSVRKQAAAALYGLDARGRPDDALREDVTLRLARGAVVTAQLPRFWFEMGRTLHTLQDAFSHTFRSADRTKVHAVLNWLDYADGTAVERRDGPSYRAPLDQCEGLDTLRAENFDVATRASRELLTIALDPSRSYDAKLAQVDALLGTYLTIEPGCAFENGWCDAPERRYETGPRPQLVGEGSGCAIAHGGGGDSGSAPIFFVALALIAWARPAGSRANRSKG